MKATPRKAMISGMLDSAAVIAPNHFKFKSLSNWSLNLFMGCRHGCPFCYVSDTSTGKQAGLLSSFGVGDPVEEWGSYVLVRPWDRGKFMASLRKAEATPPEELAADGNRAVFLCSTSDPYMVIRNSDPVRQELLNGHAAILRRSALEAICDHSTLNVRILTRSPLAREDFDLFKSFGSRLLLGVSLPSLDPALSNLFEGKSPAPRHRLKLLLDARSAGINTYVAVAPVFPGVGLKGMRDVMEAVKMADPCTIFLEPINIRLGAAQRIREQALRQGLEFDTAVFEDRGKWGDYAIKTLSDAEVAAREAKIAELLHLWPDHSALSAKAIVQRQPDREAYLRWLESYWNRISEWPA